MSAFHPKQTLEPGQQLHEQNKQHNEQANAPENRPRTDHISTGACANMGATARLRPLELQRRIDRQTQAKCTTHRCDRR